jgi:hypothetical protein
LVPNKSEISDVNGNNVLSIGSITLDIKLGQGIKLVIGGYLDRVLDLNSAYHVGFTSNPTLYFFAIVCMEHHTFIVYFTSMLK